MYGMYEEILHDGAKEELGFAAPHLKIFVLQPAIIFNQSR